MQSNYRNDLAYIHDAEFPTCVAVTAIGEVLNYAFDEANSQDARAKLFERIYAALVPGGFFIFDMAGPERAPATNPFRTFFDGDDWAVLCETDVDENLQTLVRRHTTFRKQGGMYRRDYEEHRLHLVEPNTIEETLQRIGFAVQLLNAYGSQPLPKGLTGFLAGKPKENT